MRSNSKFIKILAIQVLAILLMLEIAFRIWLKFSAESSETFNKQISEAGENKTTKVTGRITLGRLIKKSKNPDRVYEFMPNLQATYLGQDFRSNSFGIREFEYSQNKPVNTKRIIGLGDSVMFGWGVKEDQRYLNLVKEQLKKIDPKQNFQTLNFAAPGYNTTMEVATYESLAQYFEGDLVILHFVENDYGVPEFMNLPENYLSLKKSFVLDSIKVYFEQYQKNQNSKKDFVGVEFPGFDRASKKQVIAQYQHMLGNQGFRQALKKLNQLVCKKNIPVIILTGKLRSHYKNTIEHLAKKLNFQVVEAAPVVDAYFTKLGIQNDPSKRKAALWLNEKDPHPNVLGHQLYAEALLPKAFEVLGDESGRFRTQCR